MNHVSVASSNVESVAHEGTTLQVKFKDGRLYQYDNVSTADHQALMQSPSIGAHLQKHFMAGSDHPLTRLE